MKLSLSFFINKIISDRKKYTKEKYNRVLPINELFSDRWEKAKFLGFGSNSSIYDSSIVFGNVVVGEQTWIGPFTILDGSGDLIIGKNCDISSGVQIYTHDTVDSCITGNKELIKHGSVSIGDYTYIGPKSIISKNVRIGSHCIVCANSFVNKSFEDCCIVAGTPAKKIGYVEISTNSREPKKVYY